MGKLQLGVLLLALSVFSACEEDPINQIIPPKLLVNSPLNFGKSPIGVPQRGRLVLGNAGQARLEISEIQLAPDDGVFEVGVNELPLRVTSSRGQEIAIQFTPQEIGQYRTNLTFVTNDLEQPASTVELMGEGESNIICHPCSEAPVPECHLESDGMLIYMATTETSCDNEDGHCAYEMIYVPCEYGPCDPETGMCPNTIVPVFDAGTEAPPPVSVDASVAAATDSGASAVEIPAQDAGTSITDAGQPVEDAGAVNAQTDGGTAEGLGGGATCLDAPELLGDIGLIQGHYDESNDYQTAWVTANWSSGCTNHSTSDGNEVLYAVDVPNGKTLTVTVHAECANCNPENWERVDEVIYLLNTCPLDGVSYDDSLNNCVAGAQENFGIFPEDISETFSYTNTGDAQTFYVVVDAWCNEGGYYCPTSEDTFYLEWQIQ